MQTYHFSLIVEGPDMQDEVMIDASLRMAVTTEPLAGQMGFNSSFSIAKRRVLSRQCSQRSTTLSGREG